MMLRPVKFDIQKVLEWDDWKNECIPRMQHAATLEIAHLPKFLPHEGKCAVVGAAPSVKNYVEEIKELGGTEPNIVMSVNGAHGWLIKNSIIPNIHVISEMDLTNVREALGGDPHEGVAYYISSYCDPVIFQQLEGFRRVLWHPYCAPEGYQQAVAELFPEEFMVAGGFCTFFRTMSISIVLGYRELELFGVDSSFDGSSHVEGYALADKEARISIWGANPDGLRKFTTQGGLAFQAKEFLEFCEINQEWLRLRIHGDGLLRYLHEGRYPEQYH